MLTSLLACALAVASAPNEATTPEAAATSFLDAFKGMDEARFDVFFAPDVTMFFPDGPFPTERVQGREAVLLTFHAFFKLMKERGRTTLNIVPLDLQIQRYGDLAIVTFQLDGEDTVGRRSLVFRQAGHEWRIAHFHASSVDK